MVRHILTTPRYNKRISLLTLALFLLPLMLAGASGILNAAPASFADSAFKQVWEWTDAPVASGSVQRSWYWGPQPGNTRNEPYTGSASGTRLVQYFDKARMEINNPKGDRDSQWFVTTGLLVAEMVSGKQQVGDKEYKLLQPAEIAVGGDGLSVDPDAPTYTSFRAVASLRGPGDNLAPKRTGQPATATIDRAGHVGSSDALGLYPGAKLAAYSDALGHNIPSAMWDFLNLKGPVEKAGEVNDSQALANWVYVMGYPITEPYWARVKIDGIYADVLFQLYERRTLAYLPAAPKGWQVQMGNVGSHYYRWLYGGPLPSPVAQLPGAPNLPPSMDATITPLSAAPGTPLQVTIRGFRPGEEIISWFTAPDGNATDARYNLTAGPDGTLGGLSISTLGMPAGQWAITYHGKQSSHESIAYFLIQGTVPTTTPTKRPQQTPQRTGTPFPTAQRTATPTRYAPPPQGTPDASATVPVVPTEPPTGLLLSVRPGYGPPSAQFTFTARGLAPGENVQVTFTDPTGAQVYPAVSNNGQYAAGPDGTLAITLQPDQAFTQVPLGTWLFEVHGQQSAQEGVIGFTLR